MNRISGKKLKWLVIILAACLLINTWSAASSVRLVYAAEEGDPGETLSPGEGQEDTEPGGNEGQEDTESPEESSDDPAPSDTQPDTPPDESGSSQDQTDPQPGESSDVSSDVESSSQDQPSDTSASETETPSSDASQDTEPSETLPSETEPPASTDPPESIPSEVESTAAPTISDIPEDPDYLQIGDYRLKLSLTEEEPPEGFFAAYDIHTFEYSVHCFFSTNYREYVYIAEINDTSGYYVYDDVRKTLIPFVMAEEDGAEHPYMVLPLKGTENVPGQVLGEGQVAIKDAVTGSLMEVPCLYVQDIAGSKDTLFCLKSYSGTSDYYVVLENEAGNTVFLSYKELDERLREVEEEMTKSSSDDSVLPSSEDLVPSSASNGSDENKSRNSLLFNYKLWLGIIIFVILVLIIAIIIVFRMSRKQDEEEEEIEAFERNARRKHDIMNQPGGTESGYNNHYSDEPEPFDISFEDSFPEEMEVAVREAKKDYSHVDSFARPAEEISSGLSETKDLSSVMAAAEEEILARDPDLEPLFEDAEDMYEEDDDIPLIDSDELEDADPDVFEDEADTELSDKEDDLLPEDSENDTEDAFENDIEDDYEDDFEDDPDDYPEDELTYAPQEDIDEVIEDDCEENPADPDDESDDAENDFEEYLEDDAVEEVFDDDIENDSDDIKADVFEEDDLVQDIADMSEISEETSSSEEIPEDPWKGFRFADDAEVEVVRQKPVSSSEETDIPSPSDKIRTKYIPLGEEDESQDELKLDEIIMTSHVVEKSETEAEQDNNISSRSKRLNEEQELRKYVDSFIAPKTDTAAEETSSSGDDFEEIHLTED